MSNRLHDSWECSTSVPAAQLMPFSLVFPKLKKIVLTEREISVLQYLAKDVGYRTWVEYVKMREWDSVEVVEVMSSVPWVWF
jgi:hypothetical protein